MSLPSADAIRRVTDVGNLREACISLIHLCQREREAKHQFHQIASTLQNERDSLEQQLKSVRDRPDIVSELRRHNLELLAEVESLKSECAKLKNDSESWTAPAEVLALRYLVEMKDNVIVQIGEEKQKISAVLEATKNAAREKIEKLTKSLEDETELHRLEVEDLSQKCQGKFADNEALVGIRKRLTDASKAKVARLRSLKKSLQQRVEMLDAENVDQKARIEELESTTRQLKAENALMLAKLSGEQGTASSSTGVSDASETIERLNLELFELRATLREQSDLRSLVAERESMIQTLRAQIQLLMKQDSDRATTITELHSQIQQLNEQVARLSSGLSLQSSERLMTLEREKDLLEARLRTMHGHEELTQKNHRLTEMIDRSNALYAELKQECDELKRKMHKTPALSLTTVIVFQWEPEAVPRKSKRTRGEVEAAQSAYLRRLLLQFFAQEQESRVSLIPLILKLVGCDEVQVEAALRQWERGSQLFSGLFGW
jgi:chromosome segregation ATPase